MQIKREPVCLFTQWRIPVFRDATLCCGVSKECDAFIFEVSKLHEPLNQRCSIVFQKTGILRLHHDKNFKTDMFAQASLNVMAANDIAIRVHVVHKSTL
jgi:hypothetical protein